MCANHSWRSVSSALSLMVALLSHLAMLRRFGILLLVQTNLKLRILQMEKDCLKPSQNSHTNLQFCAEE